MSTEVVVFLDHYSGWVVRLYVGGRIRFEPMHIRRTINAAMRDAAHFNVEEVTIRVNGQKRVVPHGPLDKHDAKWARDAQAAARYRAEVLERRAILGVHYHRSLLNDKG